MVTESDNASTSVALNSDIGNMSVDEEYAVLLRDQRDVGAINILKRIRSGCFGTCIVRPLCDESEHSIENVSVSVEEERVKTRSLATDLVMNSFPQDDAFDETFEAKNKMNSTFQLEVPPLLSVYILAFIVYAYHFGDDMATKFIDGINMLRGSLEPYASTIVTVQLIALPLLSMIYVGLKPPIMVWKDELIAPAKVSSKNDPTEEKDISGNERSLALNPNHHSNSDLIQAIANLPDVSQWKHRPLFIQPAGNTKCPGQDVHEPVPIGAPFHFESDLFKGQILFRFKDGKSDDPHSSHAFFNHGTQNKLHRQVVIQGQFKRPLKMSQLWLGDIFEKKLLVSPPPRVGRMMSRLFNRFAPGIILDLSSNRPRILSLLGAGSHSISIDNPGEEPDITAVTLPERTPVSYDVESSAERKRILGNPETAALHDCDPDLIYTFHTFDEFLDIADYRLRLPFMTVDFTKVLGEGQPLSFRVVTSAIEEENTESLFYFRIWHERTLEKQKPKTRGRLAAKFNVRFSGV